LLLQWNYEKWALGSDLAAKVQGEIAARIFQFKFSLASRQASVSKAWEPSCHPYHFTFGLVVTASVHPQLCGTRSLSPDNDDPALLSGGRLSGGRVPSGQLTSGFDDTTRKAIMEPDYHGT
jgi:hypothetical protein